MSTVKLKTRTVSTTPKANSKSLIHSRAVKNVTNKVSKHNTQNALPDEFFLLKDASGYTIENLATLLGTTNRTVLNKKNNNESFDISQTERLRKLSRLFQEGVLIFGAKEEFKIWLEKPSYGLDNNIPATLLMQPGGVDLVMSELTAIKYGEAL